MRAPGYQRCLFTFSRAIECYCNMCMLPYVLSTECQTSMHFLQLPVCLGCTEMGTKSRSCTTEQATARTTIRRRR